MPCPSTGPKMFCAGLNFSKLCNYIALKFFNQSNLIAFSASSKSFVPAQKPNFAEWRSSFVVAQNLWDWHKIYFNFRSGQKIFVPSQNIVGHIEGD